MRYSKHARWFIGFTLLIAFMLDVLPLPSGFIWLRPEWALLVLIYWAMALPEVVGVTSAFFVGILLDFLNGTMLGEHAFAMIITIYIVVRWHRLIRVFPLIQQIFVVFGLVFLYQLILFGLQGMIGELPHTFLYWVSILVSAVLWPWVFILLRDWRRRLQVC